MNQQQNILDIECLEHFIFFRLVTNLRRFVNTLFSESLGTPVHLIFNTDEESKVIFHWPIIVSFAK